MVLGCGGTQTVAETEAGAGAGAGAEAEAGAGAEADADAGAGAGAGAGAEADAGAEAEADADIQTPDWSTLAATAHAWRSGRRHNAGGGGVQLLRPVDLRHTDCAFHQPSTGIPTVRVEEPRVGPVYPLHPLIVRRVLRRSTQDLGACASCVDGTDLFELQIGADGSVRDVEARASTHDDAARTQCLATALGQLRFPELERASRARLIVPIRMRVQRDAQ